VGKVQKCRYINKEETMKKTIGLLAILGIVWCLPAVLEAADRTLNCATGTINSFLPRLRPGDRLLVSGTCNENFTVGASFSSITLDGQGTATINGGDPNTNVVTVTGRSITITGFTITGGNTGIIVTRGGSATINGNTIQGNGSRGISVNDNASARIINNIIQNNTDDGIIVLDGGAANIGINTGSDTVASPNTIQNNTGDGVSLVRNATARVIGNTIHNNALNGVGVFDNSFAQVASNTINGNGQDGVSLARQGGVRLGADTGTAIGDAPNSTTVNNTRNGIRCRLGGIADGRIGTLNGTAGANDIAGGGSNCIDSLLP
jgi:parallel beta-helix repeat protein